MANKVEIDIITNTEKAKGNMNALKGSWTEFNSMLGVAKQAAQMAGQAYQMIVGDTVKYAETVRQLSRVTGQSSEDTSRMIQMTDDLAIELGTLEQAAKGAAMKGIAFSTESLAKLSDQYMKLSDPVSKNTFLLNTFGRAGLEMAKAMEVGGDKIREMSGAVADNMVLSQKQVQEARELEIAMDDLNDAFSGIKYSLGVVAIPKVVVFLELLSDLSKLTISTKESFIPGANAAANFINQFFLGKPAIDAFNKGLDAAWQLSDNLTRSYTAMAATIKPTFDQFLDSITNTDKQMGALGLSAEYVQQKQRDLNTTWGAANQLLQDNLFFERDKKLMEDAIAMATGRVTQAELDKRDAAIEVTQAYLDGKMGRQEYLETIGKIAEGTWSLVQAGERILALNGMVSNIKFTINGQDPADFYRNYGLGPGWGGGGGDLNVPNQPGGGYKKPVPPGGGPGGGFGFGNNNNQNQNQNIFLVIDNQVAKKIVVAGLRP